MNNLSKIGKSMDEIDINESITVTITDQSGKPITITINTEPNSELFIDGQKVYPKSNQS